MHGPRAAIDPLLTRALTGAPLLRDLPGVVMVDLVATAHLRHLHRGEVLRLQGTASDALFVVGSGAVKEHVLTDAGADVVTDLAGPGTAIGLATILDGSRDAPTCATALSTVDVLVIPGADVRASAARSPELAEALMRRLAERERRSLARRVALLSRSGRQRVLAAILDLADEYGVTTPYGTEIAVPLTQEEISSWIGVSRETMARVLHELRAISCLRTGRRSITLLDRERIEHDLRGAGDDVVILPTTAGSRS